MSERKEICNMCHHEFLPEPPSDEIVCPKCQSRVMPLQKMVYDDVKVREQIRGKRKDDNFSKKSKVRGEFIIGSEQRGSDGKWVHKERIIDRESNTYKETVTDGETGEILHECNEPLNKHRGHGSDRFKKEEKE